MKVTGPGTGPGIEPSLGPGTEPAKADAKADATNKVGGDAPTTERAEGEGKVFAERLAGANAPAAQQAGAAPVAKATGPGATSEIAADLQAGRLTPRAAVDRVLQQVLARQVGADAPAGVREKVRAALEDALENDPLLAEKLSQLAD